MYALCVAQLMRTVPVLEHCTLEPVKYCRHMMTD